MVGFLLSYLMLVLYYDFSFNTYSNITFTGREAPLVLLVFNAGPLDLTFAQESPEVDAIVACGYPSQATGDTLYQVLTMTGPHSVPAGRLSATWPAQLHQVCL